MRRDHVTWTCDGCGKVVDNEEAARGWWYVTQHLLGSWAASFCSQTCIALWADPEPDDALAPPDPNGEETP